MRPAFPFPSVWCGGTRKHLEFTRVCHVVHVCYAASNGRSGSYSATRSGFRIKFVSSFTFGCLFLLHLLFFLLFLFCLPSPLPQHRIIGLNNMKHEIDINIRNWTAAKQHSLHPPLSKADHYLSMTGVWFHSPHHFTNHKSGWINHWIEACVEKRLTELNALPEMFLRGLRKYQPGRLHRACPVFMASIRTTVAVCIEAVNACNVWSKQPKQGRE